MANEKRLIDANALAEELSSLTTVITGLRAGKGVLALFMKEYRNSVLRIVDEAPTVDAVEVVRCKGCKHWLHVEEGFGDCANPRFHLPGHADPTMNADDYCSCGERRNEG